MPTYRQRGATWRAELYKDGRRESATFPTKRQAVAWATQREQELAGARLPEHTLAEALRRFGTEVSSGRKGERWELARLGLLERDPLAGRVLELIRKTDIAELRDRRLQSVSKATVRREMNLLISVLEQCAGEWGWLRANPARGVKRPPSPPPRRRRIAADEIERVTLALGLTDLECETAGQRTALAFLFALETAMRAGEILGLTWADVGARTAKLPDTKNGDARVVPLSARARELLQALPRLEDRPCFDLLSGTRDALFRRAVVAAEVQNLHFHDSRAEAIWRLSKKLDVMELARMIGHRDIRSLMHYYEADPEELADRL